MRIAVPTEVKNNEFRVAITPVGVHELVRRGHEVYIQKGAGVGSSISDEEYVAQQRRRHLGGWRDGDQGEGADLQRVPVPA